MHNTVRFCGLPSAGCRSQENGSGGLCQTSVAGRCWCRAPVVSQLNSDKSRFSFLPLSHRRTHSACWVLTRTSAIFGPVANHRATKKTARPQQALAAFVFPASRMHPSSAGLSRQVWGWYTPHGSRGREKESAWAWAQFPAISQARLGVGYNG